LAGAIPAGDDRTVLDVGGGAGTLAPALRSAAGPGGRVVVLDRSRGMLHRAPDRLPRVQADAARLPVADAAADAVVFAFVLFLLPDARAAVAEAARVLRPGGWLLAATWGQQHSTAADAVVRDELDRAGATPFPALPRSEQLTDSQPRMTALLETAGLTRVRSEQRPLDARFDPDSALALRTGSGALGWRYARLDHHARDAVRQRIAARLAVLPPDAFVDRSQVLLTWARSP
jgi:SAM-dependent methyltransferase